MSIGIWQIAIVVVLVVLLFGRGKISDLMGDVAKGINSLNVFSYLIVLALFMLNTIFMVRAETIEVGVLTATAIQKKVYVRHVEKFKAQNPSVDVQLLFKTDSEFKKSFTKWLAAGKGPSILSDFL